MGSIVSIEGRVLHLKAPVHSLPIQVPQRRAPGKHVGMATAHGKGDEATQGSRSPAVQPHAQADSLATAAASAALRSALAFASRS